MVGTSELSELSKLTSQTAFQIEASHTQDKFLRKESKLSRTRKVGEKKKVQIKVGKQYRKIQKQISYF